MFESWIETIKINHVKWLTIHNNLSDLGLLVVMNAIFLVTQVFLLTVLR